MTEFELEQFHQKYNELKYLCISIKNDYSQLLEDEDKETYEPFTDALFDAIQLIKK